MPKVTSLSCCHVWFASVNTFYSPIWHVTSLFFFFFFWLELMEWCKFSLAYIHILTITKFSTTWNVPQCDITIQWSFLGDGYWYLGRYGFKISFIVSNHYWGCWFLWGKYFFTLDLSLTLQDHVCPSWEPRVPELAPLQPYDFGDTSYGCHADISISHCLPRVYHILYYCTLCLLYSTLLHFALTHYLLPALGLLYSALLHSPLLLLHFILLSTSHLLYSALLHSSLLHFTLLTLPSLHSALLYLAFTILYITPLPFITWSITPPSIYFYSLFHILNYCTLLYYYITGLTPLAFTLLYSLFCNPHYYTPLYYHIHILYSIFCIISFPFIITFSITPLVFTLFPVPYSILCILHLCYSTLLYYYILYYSTCLLLLNPLPIFYLSTHYYTCYTPILHLGYPKPSFTFCFFLYSPSLYPNIPLILFKLTTLPYFKIPSHFPDLLFLSLTFPSLYYIPPITTLLFTFTPPPFPLLYSTLQLSLLLHSPLLPLYPIPQHSFSITIFSFPLSNSLLLPFTLLHTILQHSLIIFPLTPLTQFLSKFPISPLLYSPLSLSILLYSPSITLILQPIQVLLFQPKIT